MRIAIFTNNYLPNPYGVSNSIESFRQELEMMGHIVYVFAPAWENYVDTNPRVFRYPAIDIKFKFKFPLPIPYSRQIDAILEKLDIDIIHSQHPNLLGSVARRWAQKKNIPLVFTWHTLYDQYVHFIPFVPHKIAAWWAIRNARKYADKCDQIIVPTQSIVKIIQDWGVQNRNIVAIATGVEENEYANADRNFVRKKYGIGEKEILLLLVSRLTDEKNIQFLFNSVQEVLKNNSHIKFIVVGGGYLLPELQKISLKQNLGKQVFFTGIISKEEIKNYYAAGDIFIHASKSETQGMILTEAMFMGLPIVAVRATGACDLVEDNKTGFLVAEQEQKFAQAVEKLISNKDLREKFSLQSVTIAREKYTAQVCAKKMLEVYIKVIERNKKE
jgi:glycosyltransferase involved in cell wall biosynthesis